MEEKEDPLKKKPKYKAWWLENNMVMLWLINSMENGTG